MTTQKLEYQTQLHQEKNRTQFNQLKLAILYCPDEIESSLHSLMSLSQDELQDVFQDNNYQLINCIYHSKYRMQCHSQYLEIDSLIKKLPKKAQKQLLLNAEFFKNIKELDSLIAIDIIQQLISSWSKKEICDLYEDPRMWITPSEEDLTDFPLAALNLILFMLGKLDKLTPWLLNHLLSSISNIGENKEIFTHICNILGKFSSQAIQLFLRKCGKPEISPFERLCAAYPDALEIVLTYFDTSVLFLLYYHYVIDYEGGSYPPFIEYLRALDGCPTKTGALIFNALYEYFSPANAREILFSGDEHSAVIDELSRYPDKILPLVPKLLQINRDLQKDIFSRLHKKQIGKSIEIKLAQHLLEIASVIATHQPKVAVELMPRYTALLTSLQQYQLSKKTPNDIEMLHGIWVNEIDKIKERLFTYENTKNLIANLLLCATLIGFLVLLTRFIYCNSIKKSNCQFFVPLVRDYEIRDDITDTLVAVHKAPTA